MDIVRDVYLRALLIFLVTNHVKSEEHNKELKGYVNGSSFDDKSCEKFVLKPYFDVEMVIGSWRAYYTWNLDYQEKCAVMVFRNATQAITNRFMNDMSEYVESQPTWDAAILHLSIGSYDHEILLFTDQGAAGKFHAVPNIVREGHMTPERHSVPLLKFAMKLVQRGRFLAIMDCNEGITTLSARVGASARKPYRSVLAAAVAELDLGNGAEACPLLDRNSEELWS